MPRILPASVVAVGVASLVAAPLLAFAVVPSAAKLPGDTDTRRTYAGLFATLLDAEALASGTGPALLADVPATVERHVTVEDTEGDVARVRDNLVVTASGRPVVRSIVDYAVDRSTLAGTASTTFGPGVIAPAGQTIGWPFDATKIDYEYWVPDLAVSVPAVYMGESELAGITTYRYRAVVDASPVVDAAVLSRLPQTLPRDVIAGLAGDLGLSADQRSALDAALEVLPDPVPLSYAYSGVTTLYVEPETGLVIASKRTESRVAELAATDVTAALTLTPVWDLTIESTRSSVADAAREASAATGRIRLLGSTLPLALGAVGLVLLGAATPVTRRRRRADVRRSSAG